MKYGRVYNFSAGPAMMPVEVLEEVAAEVLNYQGSGMSVMEMSHRSKVFQKIVDEAEADLRDRRLVQKGHCRSQEGGRGHRSRLLQG